MDAGTIRGIITLLTLITFLGICWWAYRSPNRQRFEEDGLLPFADDGAVASPVTPRRRAPEDSDE